MSIRAKMILILCLSAFVGFFYLIDWIVKDLRTHYKQGLEEVLIDTSRILASLLEVKNSDTIPDTHSFAHAFEQAYREPFSAAIFSMTKQQVDLRVYVTDASGQVLFDSTGRHTGQDFSKWRDVVLTLRGEYGARSTQEDPNDVMSSVYYVAAPIKLDGRIVGVVTVGKPSTSINRFIEAAKPKLRLAGLITAAVVVVFGIVFTVWITVPIQKLTHYAQSVRDGKKIPIPSLGGGEIGQLGTAFEEMRAALEGKKHVENYLQTFTHELKSPLAAIQGSLELIEGENPPPHLHRFTDSIQIESERIRLLVDRLLALVALENRLSLQSVEEVDLSALVREGTQRFEGVFQKKSLELELQADVVTIVRGEKLLLEQVLVNLIENAIQFSPLGGKIRIKVLAEVGRAQVQVEDDGPGMPDYAVSKVFDRFYSLARPDTGKKSTGLGLTFVKEAIELHGGSVLIENRHPQGVRAAISIPV